MTKINKILSIILLVFILCFISVTVFSKHLYAQITVLVVIDGNTLGFADYNGDLWLVEGVEDWQIGDYCSMIMFDNFTDGIEDDVILSTKYSGWLDGNWGVLPHGAIYFTTAEAEFEED